jgi:hypothetical protein
MRSLRNPFYTISAFLLLAVGAAIIAILIAGNFDKKVYDLSPFWDGLLISLTVFGMIYSIVMMLSVTSTGRPIHHLWKLSAAGMFLLDMFVSLQGGLFRHDPDESAALWLLTEGPTTMLNGLFILGCFRKRSGYHA